MAGDIKHAFVSTVPDEGVAGEVGPDEWNAALKVSGGADGQFMVRRTSATNGWELVNAAVPLSFISTTHADNVGAAETDLHSFVIPAAHFNVNNRAIRLKTHISFAGNATAKTVRVRFGAAFVAVLNPTTGSPNGSSMAIELVIARTGSNAQHVYGHVLLAAAVELIAHATATETDANALTLKITGQGGANADISAHATTIEFLN